MGITVAAIPAAEANLSLNSGCPMMVASNALERASTAPRWVNSTDMLYTDTDITALNFPTRLAYDRYQNRPTKPDEALGTAWRFSFVFKLRDGAVFDTVFVMGHNFHEISALSTWRAQLDLADDAGFSVNHRPVVTAWTGNTGAFPTALTNHRIVSSRLGSGPTYDRYTVGTGGYGRLTIGNGGFATTPLIALPQFGELVLGRRRQMFHKPNEPYDDYGLGADSTNQRSKSGVDTDYIRNAGGRNVTINLSPSEADDTQSIQDWYKDCGYGPQKFIWFENPDTTFGFTKAYWMRAPERLPMPLVGPIERDVSFDLIEQSPFVSEES